MIPKHFANEHKKWLKESGLKGRVYIGQEGINGTLGGTPNKFRQYANISGVLRF
jgi:UPF0176 protein